MTRVPAFLTALLFAAFPVRAALADPQFPWAFKLGWVLLFMAGMIRPAWRAPIVLLAVPFAPWVPFEIKGVPYGLVHLVVLSQAIPWLLSRGGLEAAVRGPVAWSWLLLVGLALASLIVQYAGYAVVFETSGAFWLELGRHLADYPDARPGPRLEHMLGAAMALATGALVFALIRTAPWPRARLLECLAGVAVAVALVGFWQAYTGAGLRFEWRVNDPFITRINATFSDPNALAAFLAATLPLVLGLAGQRRGRARVWWIAGAVAVSVALVMTAGRIAAVAALIGACTMAALVARAGVDRIDPSPLMRRLFRRGTLAVAAGIVVAAIGLAVAGTMLDARHAGQYSYLDTWLYTFNLRRPLEAAKGRLAIWQTAVQMIENRPAYGIGVGRIYRLFGYYARDLGDLPPGMTFSAHSTFLNIGAELGLVGLLVWLGLLGTSVREALTRLRSATPASSENGWTDAGLAGGLVALTVTMTTGDRAILYEDLVLIGALTGLLAWVGTHAPPPPATVDRRLRHAAAALGVVVLISLPFRVVAERREVPLERVTSGLHPAETSRHGIKFRWTTGHATFHLPAPATSLRLRFRSVAAFPQSVEIRVHGSPIFASQLADDQWIELRPVLPPMVTGYHRIEVLVSPTWIPKRDGRELGVMLVWDWR